MLPAPIQKEIEGIIEILKDSKTHEWTKRISAIEKIDSVLQQFLESHEQQSIQDRNWAALSANIALV